MDFIGKNFEHFYIGFNYDFPVSTVVFLFGMTWNDYSNLVQKTQPGPFFFLLMAYLRRRVQLQFIWICVDVEGEIAELNNVLVS